MAPRKPTPDAPVPQGLPSVADATPAPGHPNGPLGGNITFSDKEGGTTDPD
jgi:hypothetical protein